MRPSGEVDPDELAAHRAEVERAAGHYYHSSQQVGIDRRTKRFVLERCLPYISGPRVLDLGYVDGQWTDEVLGLNCQVDIVEGAASHVKAARERYAGNPSVRVFHALFQEHRPDGDYATIIAGDMIRYLSEPEVFLRRAATWLTPTGRLIVTVPNSRSLHRRVGALMGMEGTPTQANHRDVQVGNLRSYDRYEFRDVLRHAGLQIEVLRGCFLKPLSSDQMEGWTDELLRAFLDVGNELEDYCWFLYAVCKGKQ